MKKHYIPSTEKEKNVVIEDCLKTPMKFFNCNITIVDTFVYNCDFVQCNFIKLEYTTLVRCTFPHSSFMECKIHRGHLADCSNIPFHLKFLSFTPPSEGEFYAYKKLLLASGEPVVAKLLIPAKAYRSSALSNKCRANAALPLWIKNSKGKEFKNAYSWFDSSKYTVGKMFYPHTWTEDRWEQCGAGVHFFMSEKQAWEYDFS